jgi:hypothetical protein
MNNLLHFAVRRLWRERRVMSVLLLAMLFVTSFLALAPLYVRAVAASEFDVRLTNLTAQQSRIDLINPSAMNADETLNAHLGETITDTVQWATSTTQCSIGIQSGSPPSYLTCFRPYLYPELESLFSVAEGRLPQVNSDVIEVAITENMAAYSQTIDTDFVYEVGQRYTIQDEETSFTAEIVGILAPVIPPDDAFWDNQVDLFGLYAPNLTGSGPDNFDYGLIFEPDGFQQIVDAFAPDEAVYTTRVALDPEMVRNSGDVMVGLEMLASRIINAQNELRLQYPNVEVRSPIRDLIAQFQAEIAETERPVIFLALLIEVLMLYNFVTTVSLVLEQQSEEWGVIASRGVSSRQLLGLQLLTAGIFGIMVFLLGPLVAWLMLAVLSLVGPQADILEIPSLSTLPINVFLLSGIASLVATAALTAAAVPLSRDSFFRLKRSASRPPAQPRWAAYYLDLLMVVLGIGFLLRAYGGNLNTADPFNLVGPVLLLTGVVLLWIRIFPYLIRFLGYLLRNLNALSLQIALWTVERDSGHYAQLILSIVGTLALGTASLAVLETRSSEAWEVARTEIGADARVSFSPQAQTLDWSTLADVSGTMQMMVIESADFGQPTAYLIGQSSEQPFLSGASSIPEMTLPGLALPADLSALTLEVYAPAADEITQTHVTVELYNRDRVRVLIPMTTEDNTLTDTWMTYRAELDPATVGRPPWSLAGLSFPSRQEADDRFEHELYLDNFQMINSDGEATLLDGFEAETLHQWVRPSGRSLEGTVLVFDNDAKMVAEGENSLQVLYNVVAFSSQRPSLDVLPTEVVLPAIVNTTLAQQVGQTSTLRRTLQIGDEVTSEFDNPESITSSTRIRLSYRVLDIVDAVPGFTSDLPILITNADALQHVVNARLNQQNYLGFNQLWLSLDSAPVSQPSDELRSQLSPFRVNFAWDRFNAIQRAPLANAITGMLFAGFWVSLSLIVLDFGFYLAMTLRRRASSFAILRSMGWGQQHLLRTLTLEQAAFITPALVVGLLAGITIGSLLLPFLTVNETSILRIPADQILLLLTALIAVIAVLVLAAANYLRRIRLNEAIREG